MKDGGASLPLRLVGILRLVYWLLANLNGKKKRKKKCLLEKWSVSLQIRAKNNIVLKVAPSWWVLSSQIPLDAMPGGTGLEPHGLLHQEAGLPH